MLTNEELIIRIKNGEKTLENDLYNNVKGLIYQTSYDFYNKHKVMIKKIGLLDIDDLVQIANYTFIKSISKFKVNKDILFSTYLVQSIKTNLLNQFYKNKKVSREYRKDIDKVEYDENYSSSYTDKTDIKIFVEELMSVLNERERNIITDKYLIGLKCNEMVNKYGISSQAINNLIHKALNKMKKEWSEKI